jgi:hypothetical protein
MRFFLICILVISVCFPRYGTGQQVINTSAETDWQLAPVVSNNGPSPDIYYARTFRDAVLRFDKAGMALPVQYKKDEFGIVFVDGKGNPRWQATTKGIILGQAKMGNNIICFYSPEWNSLFPRKILQTIYAGLYDIKNGKLIKEKVVLENVTGLNIDSKVMISPDKQFGQLLIRYTPYGRVFFSVSAAMEKFQTTEKLSVISVSESLEVKVSDISSMVQQGEFIGCISLSKQEFAVATRLGNQVVTEKFNLSSLASPEKYTVQLTTHDKSSISAILQTSADQPGILYEGFRYQNTDKDRVVALCRVNLDAKTTKIREMVMNKSFTELLADDKEAQKRKLGKVIDNMDLVDIAIQPDKVMLLTQIRFVIPGRGAIQFSGGGGFNSSSARRNNNQIMITVFDTGLVKFNPMIVDRKFELFLQTGEKPAWKIYGNFLHLLYNINDGIRSIDAEYTVVDLNNYSIVQRVALAKEGLRRDASIEPEAVVWAEKDVLVPYNNMAGTKNGQTVIQQIALKK